MSLGMYSTSVQAEATGFDEPTARRLAKAFNRAYAPRVSYFVIKRERRCYVMIKERDQTSWIVQRGPRASDGGYIGR